MKIIVGLGNPGGKYLFNRHNLGFMLIDALAQGISFQNKFNSSICKIQIQEQSVLLVKPQTFMNLSGQACREILNFYKSPLENLLVIHDDKDLYFGTMKFQKLRGHGGHNGIRNIHQELSSQNYCRLKMGVAQKIENLSENHKTQQDTAHFVLDNFNSEELKFLPSFLEKGIQAVHFFIRNSYEKTANQFNSKELDLEKE